MDRADLMCPVCQREAHSEAEQHDRSVHDDVPQPPRLDWSRRAKGDELLQHEHIDDDGQRYRDDRQQESGEMPPAISRGVRSMGNPVNLAVISRPSSGVRSSVETLFSSA